jgi:hypothetical protein
MNMKKLIFTLCMSLLTLTACKKEANSELMPINKSFEIKKGILKANAEEGINIKLDSVVTDSRCPSDVECIWAGTAAASFTCKIESARKICFVLFINADTVINGYRIKHLDLKPYPVSTIQTFPDDYTAEILITKE